eukprot:14671821-Alexandrium_andersonii.AAC.1
MVPFRAIHLFTDGSAPGSGLRSPPSARAAWALVAVGVAAHGAYSFLGWSGGPIPPQDSQRLG